MSAGGLRFVNSDDPTFTSTEALRALEAWVGRSWFRSRRVARELTMTRPMSSTGAYHVKLLTLVETRRLTEGYRPYRGEPLDGREHGPPPGKWTIEADPPEDFSAKRVECILPHTEAAHTCSMCGGRGEETCGRCGGAGQVACSSCQGSGSTSTFRTTSETNSDGTTSSRTEWVTESCSWCSGGRVGCTPCLSSGRVTCATCEGQRRIVHFTRLIVEWVVRADVRILERTELPDDLVGEAEPIDHVAMDAAAIAPVLADGGGYRGAGTGHVSPEVNPLVDELIELHRARADERNLRQRLAVSGVPVHEIRYRAGEREQALWIYGADRRVHAPGFPRDRLRTVAAVIVLVALALIAGALCLGLSGPAGL